MLYRVYDTTCSGPIASYYNPFRIMLGNIDSRVWVTDADDSVLATESANVLGENR